MSEKIRFPEDFLWGTATSAYQVEGAAWEDGRGESVWDRFARTPGKVFNGDNGDVACDSYHRLDEDLDLLQALGVTTYRFSIAWPRLFPEKGKYLASGLDYYKRLLAGLHARGISPTVTIYHWDLPQWIDDEGGWLSRRTVDYYLEYAEVVFRELGALVPRWITHNEPWCSSFLSFGIGKHAPGHQDWAEAVVAAHHILYSHGRAVQRFRDMGMPGQIGIALNLNQHYPASESDADRAACDLADAFSNRWFLDPVFKGSYPERLKTEFDRYVTDWSFIEDGDLASIATPIDFLAVNYYSGGPVAFDEGRDSKADLTESKADLTAGEQDSLGHDEQNVLPHIRNVPTGRPKTDTEWEIYPEGLYHLLTRVRKDYTGDLPLYITENGAAFKDQLVRDSAGDSGGGIAGSSGGGIAGSSGGGIAGSSGGARVDDRDRIDFLDGHFRAAHRFISEGGPLHGYYVWSLLDNYEWSEGYSKRFGIVYVDFDTLERTPKASYAWYRNVIRENGLG